MLLELVPDGDLRNFVLSCRPQGRYVTCSGHVVGNMFWAWGGGNMFWAWGGGNMFWVWGGR